ncbi:MAG: hypothetical protein IKH88_07490, partial [Prevotella sp.]|nr:hypothetical protein [Prevotella sp.]
NCFRDYSGGHKTRPYDFGGGLETAVQKAVCIVGGGLETAVQKAVCTVGGGLETAVQKEVCTSVDV